MASGIFCGIARELENERITPELDEKNGPAKQGVRSSQGGPGAGRWKLGEKRSSGHKKMKVHPAMLMKTKAWKNTGIGYLVSGLGKSRGDQRS
jgi:hypothetical protein